MKHPDHGIKAFIVTEDGTICPESNVKIKGRVMSCKIPGFPGAMWHVAFLIDLLMPTVATRCVYYIYETYLERFLIDGPLIIDRRLKTSRSRLSPSRDGDTEVFFFLPTRINGQDKEGYAQPKDWLIELKVYESDECFYDPRIPLSSAQAIINRRDGVLPRLERFRDPESERLIIHYKWEYRCMELLPGSLEQKSPPVRQEEKTTKPGIRQVDMGKDPKEKSQYISKQPISCTSSSVGEDLESLPEYSWGPQPKNPPSWKQKGKDSVRLNINSKGGIGRGRSPLGKRAFDAEGLSTQSRKPVALQRCPSRSERPMLPMHHPKMPWLPSGWELRYTSTYNVYYVNHNDKYTTWRHPLADKLELLEKDATYQPDQDREVGEEEDDGEHNRYTCTRLQKLNERKELLRIKRAGAEVNVQRLLLGHIESSEWRETNIEHWFPDSEASESIIEHIHTYFGNPRILKRALRIRDTIVEESTSLAEELDKFHQFASVTTLESGGPGLSAAPQLGCNEVGAIEDRRKKRSSEELEEEDELAQGSSNQQCVNIGGHASNIIGRINYREDYGPEVPVTRDGEIDPDWHRDKMARIEGPFGMAQRANVVSCDGKHCTESRKIRKEYDENPLLEQVYPMPRTSDSLNGDVGDDYENQIERAIDQSLKQYDVGLRKAVEPPTENSVEPSGPKSSEHIWETYDHSLWEKASHQRPILENNNLDGCGVETNKKPEYPIPRRVSGLSIVDDIRELNIDNDHNMETKDILRLPEHHCTGDREEINTLAVSVMEQIDTTAGVSPSRPVPVLEEVQSAILQSDTAAFGQASSENQRNHDEQGTTIPNIQHIEPTTETQTKTFEVCQTSSLPAGRGPTSAPEGKQVVGFFNDGPGEKSDTTSVTKSQHDTPTVVGPFDNRPIGEASATAPINKSKKKRRERKKSDTGNKDPCTSSIPLEGKDHTEE